MRRLSVLFLTLPLLFCLWGAPACASTTASHATASVVHGAAVPDSQIDATIHTKLAKSKIGKDGFKYHVQHGVVTWEGTTNVIQHKGSATRMARTAGATQVINNIQISAGAKAKAMANLKKAQVVQ